MNIRSPCLFPSRRSTQRWAIKIVNAAFVALTLNASCVEAQQRQPSIGYPSVGAALKALSARSDVSVSVQNGWTIFKEKDGLTLWTFAPSDHPAYPAVAKRIASEKNGAWSMTTDLLCEAEKAPCEKLAADYNALDEQMRQAIERDHKAQRDAPADRPPASPPGTR
jgi:hypothetical protein